MDFEIARRQMISQQLRAWHVLDVRVLEAMAEVPRELFVPPDWRGLAYADAEIPVGAGRRLAPPKIQGRALQAVDPRPADHALEIGTGTGYLAACLAKLAGRVTGVESDPGLAARARETLARLGISNAEVVEGDGLSMEFPQRFDVVCVSGSLPEGSERLERRLQVGGRLFMVTGRPPLMQAVRVVRIGEGEWGREKLFETSLPPLEGARQPEEFVF